MRRRLQKVMSKSESERGQLWHVIIVQKTSPDASVTECSFVLMSLTVTRFLFSNTHFVKSEGKFRVRLPMRLAGVLSVPVYCFEKPRFALVVVVVVVVFMFVVAAYFSLAYGYVFGGTLDGADRVVEGKDQPSHSVACCRKAPCSFSCPHLMRTFHLYAFSRCLSVAGATMCSQFAFGLAR